MEKKKVSAGEALSFVFRGENFLKFILGTVICGLPMTLFYLAVASFQQSQNFNLGKLIGLGGLYILVLFCSLILSGYILLYMHDRALDKNAKLRDWSDSIGDAILAQIKSGFGFALIGIFFWIVLLIPTFLLGLIPILGAILDIIIFIVAFILILRLFFTINPFFAKDLKFTSLFKWGEAFAFAKDVHYGIGALLLPILLFFVGVGIVFLINVIGIMISDLANIPVMYLSPINYIVSFVIQIYLTFYFASIFGQFSYNAIEQNMRRSPETLPKEINKDKIAIVVCIIVLIGLLLIPIALGALAAVAIPSLIKQQGAAVSRTKIMKGISDYEMVATAYMAEYEKTNIRDLTTNNCANIGTYFKIKQQNGCDFTTYDGAYWQFNYDGSATVSDSAVNPATSVKVGVCYDGTLNCESEYPDAYELKSGRLR